MHEILIESNDDNLENKNRNNLILILQFQTILVIEYARELYYNILNMKHAYIHTSFNLAILYTDIFDSYSI